MLGSGLYQKATGTNYSLSSNAVQGTDYNRSFEYINEEGIKVVISAEELAAAKAIYEKLGGDDFIHTLAKKMELWKIN